MLQYEILPGAGYEKFKMHSDSGELVTAASLDRETQEVFSIKGSSVKYLLIPLEQEVRTSEVLLSALLFSCLLN